MSTDTKVREDLTLMLQTILQALTSTVPSMPKVAQTAKPDKWKARDLAHFLEQHCRGTGRTYQWIIETFSKGKVTLHGTPSEYERKLGILYVRMKKVRAILEPKWCIEDPRNPSNELVFTLLPRGPP